MRYPGPLDIIVVTTADHGTNFVARAHGAKALCLTHLPRRLKRQAERCTRLSGSRPGLLFTDADTVHQPDSAAQAVDHATRNRPHGLSLFLRQDCGGWIDRLALTAAYAGLFAGARPQDMLLNGQYILLRRDVYETSGGFASGAAKRWKTWPWALTCDISATTCR